MRIIHNVYRGMRSALPLFAAYLLSACAFVWRRLMFRTTFIAITGSLGKTTATDSLGAILSAHFPTSWTPGGENSRADLARTILRTRFRDRFMVIEVGTRAPGALRRAAWMIAPDIAVVLKVARVHSNAFPTLECVAAEKAQLLSRLGKRGLALLNADDPLVLSMAAHCRAPVRTFGSGPGNLLTASEVSSRWPDRLRFRVHRGDESCMVETNFVGEHLLVPALAALATAVCCGLPLEQAAGHFKQIPPAPRRMQPMLLPSGATVLRNDFNPTLAAFDAALKVLAEAEAARRIVIVGDVLDAHLTVRPRVRDLGRRIGLVADMAVFLGAYSRIAAKAAIDAGLKPEAALAFTTLGEAARFLNSELRQGDLVLVHGWTGRHIERVILPQFETISCWMERCGLFIGCDQCSYLRRIPRQSPQTDAPHKPL